MKIKELKTDRLILRKLNKDDIKLLWDNFYSDYDKYKFYDSKKINSYEELAERITEQIANYDKDECFRWAIVEKESNELIGNINFHHYNEVHNNIKLGYFILDNYRNKGYATESVLKVINFAFKKLKVHRISASAISTNEASNRVLIKSGFLLEGTKKEYSRIDGKYYDGNIYGLINSEDN